MNHPQDPLPDPLPIQPNCVEKYDTGDSEKLKVKWKKEKLKTWKDFIILVGKEQQNMIFIYGIEKQHNIKISDNPLTYAENIMEEKEKKKDLIWLW